MIVLHDHPWSSNALKVRFLLAELGLPYERREVPLARPRPAEYVAINPVAGIPALEADGLVISESHAILRFLARREGREDLYPVDAAAAAPIEEWLDRFAMTLRPALFRVEAAALGYVPGRGFRAAAPDPDEARRRAAEIAPVLATFDGLVDQSGLALGRFTIADCAAAPALWRTNSTELDLTAYPRLRRWRDTVCARPAFTQAEPVM